MEPGKVAAEGKMLFAHFLEALFFLPLSPVASTDYLSHFLLCYLFYSLHSVKMLKKPNGCSL